MKMDDFNRKQLQAGILLLIFDFYYLFNIFITYLII